MEIGEVFSGGDLGDEIQKEIDENEAALSHETGLPKGHHLIKSMMDPFDYALKLRSGETVRFEYADSIGGGWVRLTLKYWDDPSMGVGKDERIAFPAPRGVDVRISDIVWVMDAPMGS